MSDTDPRGAAPRDHAHRDSALIVVDMQNAFIEPADGPAVAGATAAVAAVNEHVAEFARHDRPVFYTRDVAPADGPDRDTEIHPDVRVAGRVVDKGPGRTGGMSGFVLDRDGAGAGGVGDLATLLAATGCRSLLVIGIAGDVCVAATARDAVRLGYAVTVDLTATAFVHAHPDGDAAAVAELRAAGITITGTIPGEPSTE